MSINLELIQTISDMAEEILKERSNRYDWDVNARPEQKIPTGKWSIWMILAGRGFGKTRTGSETIRKLIENGYRNICLLGETIMDVRRVMIEGESGLLNIYPTADRPTFYSSRNLLLWPNGAKAHIFSGERPDSLRGPQFDAAWIDELAKFEHADECWDQLMMALRLGNPKAIITTTPKPTTLINALLKKKNLHLTTGTTLDNKDNLSEDFLECILSEYADTQFGKQEIYGELLNDKELVLWNNRSIVYADAPEQFSDIVVAIDPAVTNGKNSDETGIVVVGKSGDCYYILEDASIKSSVSIWAEIAVNMFHRYGASKVVVEVNQGGDLIKEVILQSDKNIVIEEVRAIKNKYIRAQSAAMLYEKGIVYHVRKFPELEKQMTDFAQVKNSPDRVDALVWGLNHLKGSRKNITIF